MSDIHPDVQSILNDAKKLDIRQLGILLDHIKIEHKARIEARKLDNDFKGIKETLHKKVQKFLQHSPRAQGIHEENHIAFHNGQLFSEDNYDHKLVAEHPDYQALLAELQSTYNITASFEYYDNDYGTTCLHIKEVKGIPVIPLNRLSP